MNFVRLVVKNEHHEDADRCAAQMKAMVKKWCVIQPNSLVVFALPEVKKTTTKKIDSASIRRSHVLVHTNNVIRHADVFFV